MRINRELNSRKERRGTGVQQNGRVTVSRSAVVTKILMVYKVN